MYEKLTMKSTNEQSSKMIIGEEYFNRFFFDFHMIDKIYSACKTTSIDSIFLYRPIHILLNELWLFDPFSLSLSLFPLCPSHIRSKSVHVVDTEREKPSFLIAQRSLFEHIDIIF